MSRAFRVGALALGLLALSVADGALGESEGSACEDQCAVAEATCFDACGQDEDPSACEQACTESADACFEDCEG